MRPVAPVLRKRKSALPEIVYGADQKEYIPLPAVRCEHGVVTTRWALSLRERLRVFVTGSMYLQVLTFNAPLQPVKLRTDEPEL
jgi:hypothetical protein